MQWPISDFELSPSGGFVHVRCRTQFFHVADLRGHNSEVCALSRKMSGLDKPKQTPRPPLKVDPWKGVLVSDVERELLER